MRMRAASSPNSRARRAHPACRGPCSASATRRVSACSAARRSSSASRSAAPSLTSSAAAARASALASSARRPSSRPRRSAAAPRKASSAASRRAELTAAASVAAATSRGRRVSRAAAWSCFARESTPWACCNRARDLSASAAALLLLRPASARRIEAPCNASVAAAAAAVE
eukprot:scaffold134_cov111-Isochrysis_galbana.AAC.10